MHWHVVVMEETDKAPSGPYGPVTEELCRVVPLGAKIVKFWAIFAGELNEDHVIPPATLVNEPVLIH